jgi:hypothetical protein
MSAKVLERLQENKLQGLEELEKLIASYEDAVATSDGGDEAAAIADFFVDEGIGLWQSSVRLWEHSWTMALAGRLADRRERGMTLRCLLERGGRIMARGAAIARAYADRSGHQVARLGQFEEQAKSFSVWIEECMALWDTMDRSHKPVDRERVARAQAAYQRGECEDPADIIARLKQGGSIAKE